MAVECFRLMVLMLKRNWWVVEDLVDLFYRLLEFCALLLFMCFLVVSTIYLLCWIFYYEVKRGLRKIVRWLRAVA